MIETLAPSDAFHLATTHTTPSLTMPSDLPYAADAEQSLSREELDVLRRQYEKERATGHITVQVGRPSSLPRALPSPGVVQPG